MLPGDETKSIGSCDQPIKWGSETITLFVASVPIGEADAICFVQFSEKYQTLEFPKR